MRVDPAIDALRRNRAAQCRAREAMAGAAGAWRADAAVRDVLADLERFGAGAALARCPALAAVMRDGGEAARLIGALCQAFAAALSRAPLGQPPFRHGYDGELSTLLLARSGRAQLVLQAREPGRHRFETATFSDARRWEIVLAGRASARIVRRAGQRGALPARPLALEAGTSLALDLSRASLQVLCVERRLVSLRLQRAARAPAPTREHALADGALLRQSCGDLAGSRREMILALLGRMGRLDAAPPMAAIALAPGDDSLRWQALRECLVLDAAAGFRALDRLACRASDPLAAPAGALRAQLIEQHPELLALEDARCPA